ncbi:MAG TPA: magnesium transporter [Candidatus Nanoarchaeia archaeon]|nr:magnesium transporter [Candidatus Nanoarchaeia archaeon]
MGLFDKDFKEILFSQSMAVIGGIIAGTLLALYTDKILLIPGMVILIPGFLEMRGNISGTLSARLSSGLFLGVFKSSKEKKNVVSGNIIASFILAAIVSLILGLIAYLFNYLIFKVSTPEIIMIALVAGILGSLIQIPLALFFTFYLFKKGHDPTNIMGPLLTTTGDIISILALLIALVII